MDRNPYRKRRPKGFLNGYLLVTLSLIFAASNFFLTTWLPLDVPDRSLSRLVNGYGHIGKIRQVKLNNSLLHVVTTRFMQGQPKLIALAKARLQLFETFCLPTMLNQETDDFLWFVMIDPELDSSLLQRLKSLLEDRSNFYLIASNAKLLTPSDVTEILSSEERDSIDATTQQKVVLTGDIQLLQNRMLDKNRPLLLETRLDADDGLRFDALSQIQTLAQSLPVDTRGWQIICNNIHYEWRNEEILAINYNSSISISSGKLRVVKESICVTPGYTLVRHREPLSTDFPSWPKLGHNLVAREWPECRVANESIVEAFLEGDNNGNATFDCWKKMSFIPIALRSRTVTSAGMSRVESKAEESKKFENRTKMFWSFVTRDLNIEPEKTRLTSQYMRDNLHNIALDNLKGQW